MHKYVKVKQTWATTHTSPKVLNPSGERSSSGHPSVQTLLLSASLWKELCSAVRAILFIPLLSQSVWFVCIQELLISEFQWNATYLESQTKTVRFFFVNISNRKLDACCIFSFTMWWTDSVNIKLAGGISSTESAFRDPLSCQECFVV